MNYSENYGFALPDDGDFYDIAPISENFDAIDTILAEGESKMEEISNKIGTPAENGQTLFSLLSSGGGSVIRSIQHVIHPIRQGNVSSSISFSPVNVDKTIVISEMLENDYSTLCKVTYTLESSQIVCSHPTLYGNMTYGFWIVEFV